MAEPLVTPGLTKPPNRNELAKFLPNHEAIIFMENLFRIVGSLLPEDLEILYSLVNNLTNNVRTTKVDYTVLTGNYSIMADAIDAPVTIKLPSAASDETYIVGTTKIDSSDNIVTIIPNGTDLIAGETSHELLAQNEVLNFISDGENWQLAN